MGIYNTDFSYPELVAKFNTSNEAFMFIQKYIYSNNFRLNNDKFLSNIKKIERPQILELRNEHLKNYENYKEEENELMTDLENHFKFDYNIILDRIQSLETVFIERIEFILPRLNINNVSNKCKLILLNNLLKFADSTEKGFDLISKVGHYVINCCDEFNPLNILNINNNFVDSLIMDVNLSNFEEFINGRYREIYNLIKIMIKLFNLTDIYVTNNFSKRDVLILCEPIFCKPPFYTFNMINNHFKYLYYIWDQFNIINENSGKNYDEDKLLACFILFVKILI